MSAGLSEAERFHDSLTKVLFGGVIFRVRSGTFNGREIDPMPAAMFRLPRGYM